MKQFLNYYLQFIYHKKPLYPNSGIWPTQTRFFGVELDLNSGIWWEREILFRIYARYFPCWMSVPPKDTTTATITTTTTTVITIIVTTANATAIIV